MRAAAKKNPRNDDKKKEARWFITTDSFDPFTVQLNAAIFAPLFLHKIHLKTLTAMNTYFKRSFALRSAIPYAVPLCVLHDLPIS
jgi:hypothetical protein